MASKTISITEEIYTMLQKLKLPHESFGDVIKRLCEEKTPNNLLNWVHSHPLWSDMTADESKSIEIIKDHKKTSFTINTVDFE